MLLTNGLDETLFLQLGEENTGDGTVDLEFLDETGTGDGENLGDLVHQFIVALFIKENIVVKLILDLHLSP